MGLFDRFKKEKAGGKDTPSLPLGADTAGKLLFLRERLEGQELREAVTRRFGPEALGEISQEHPAVTSFLVRLEGMEFWCAHMALPLPPKEGDLPALLARSSFFSQEELEGAAGHRCWWGGPFSSTTPPSWSRTWRTRNTSPPPCGSPSPKQTTTATPPLAPTAFPPLASRSCSS